MTEPGIKHIEWKEEFSLGIPDVDHEHRELIKLINELLVNISTRKSDDMVLEYLGEIYSKIALHFALEEKIMQEQRYDEYNEHKQDHDRLLDEILTIMDEYEETSVLDESPFAERLTHWFTDHFRTKDARFHKYLHNLPTTKEEDT